MKARQRCADYEGKSAIHSREQYATPKGNVLNHDASLNATLARLDRYRMSDAKARHLGE